MFTAESDSERILKIGQHLPKLWAIKYRVVFLMKHSVWAYLVPYPRYTAISVENRKKFPSPYILRPR